ncbi:MAG TPA: hypothetical protein DCQ93_00600 [Bacteroidetes bacterium]|mgnify:CR=1 FL=1|nr:hypothetical protein [Bacteroidota bacterium]
MKATKTFFLPVLAALVFASIIPASAQMQMEGKKYYTGTSISLRGGISSAYTDIRTFDFARTSTNGVSEWTPGFGISATRMFSSVFGAQLNFNYAKLVGISNTETVTVEDKNIYQKLGFPGPVYFKTNVMNYGLNMYVNLSNLSMTLKKANQKPKSDRRIGFYTVFGVGLLSFDSKIYDLPGDTFVPGAGLHGSIADGAAYDSVWSVGKTANSRIGGYLRGTTGKTMEVDFPWSFGLKYKISRSLDLGIQNDVHFLVTDKLDAYVRDLNSAVKKSNDKWMLTSLSLTYKFVGKDENKDYIEWMDPTETMYDEYQLLADKMRKMTQDSDNDGVADIFDKEPNTAAGNKVDGAGVSMDVDGDGVVDSKDADLFTPKGATVDADGKPNDADGDGVPDVNDKEPNTKPGALVNYQGKTIKQDFPTQVSTGYTPTSIFFDLNKSEVKVMYYPELSELAKYMKANSSVKIKLTGNADERGADGYNNDLGMKRANAVKDYLVKYYGIDGGRIETATNGEKNPLQKTAYSVNRRVDVEIK